jgi:hypothetical protein
MQNVELCCAIEMSLKMHLMLVGPRFPPIWRVKLLATTRNLVHNSIIIIMQRVSATLIAKAHLSQRNTTKL